MTVINKTENTSTNLNDAIKSGRKLNLELKLQDTEMREDG